MASPPVPTDVIAGIGEGTKLLLDSLAHIHGESIQKRIVVGIKTVDATQGNRTIKTMVIDVETLRLMMEFVCRNVRRRHLIGLNLVLTRMDSLLAYDFAITSDLMAKALAMLAIQMHSRRGLPTRRQSSIGGKFDKIRSAWSEHGVASFMQAVTEELLATTTKKGRLS